MDQVVAAIRRMEATGDLFLIVKEEGEDEDADAATADGAAAPDHGAGG